MLAESKEMLKEILKGYSHDHNICLEGSKRIDSVLKMTKNEETGELKSYTIFIVYVNGKIDFINEDIDKALNYYSAI